MPVLMVARQALASTASLTSLCMKVLSAPLKCRLQYTEGSRGRGSCQEAEHHAPHPEIKLTASLQVE